MQKFTDNQFIPIKYKKETRW